MSHTSPETLLHDQWRGLALVGRAMRPRESVSQVSQHIIPLLPAITGMNTILCWVTRPDDALLDLVADCNVPAEERAAMFTRTFTREQAQALLRPEFAERAPGVFRVPPAHLALVSAVTHRRSSGAWIANDTWTAQDTLVLPLYFDDGQPLSGVVLFGDLTTPDFWHPAAREQWLELLEATRDTVQSALGSAYAYESADRGRRLIESGVTEFMRLVDQAQRGNFTVQLPVRDSFLGTMADLFNQLIRRLNETLTGMRHASQVVTASTVTVGALTGDVTAKANDQAARIARISEAIAQVAGAITQIAATSVNASDVAETILEFSNQGRSATEDAVREMEQAREVSLQAMQRVKRLEDGLQEVADISKDVSEAASRANLLALNASIEADRASRDGAGLAAIAREIRALAVSSNDAATRINQRVLEIVAETQGVVTVIDTSAQRIVEQSSFLNDAGAALEGIAEVAAEIAEMNGSIRADAGAQAAHAQALTGDMSAILGITDATRHGVGQIDEAMERLILLAASLRDLLAQFTLAFDDAPDRFAQTIVRPIMGDETEQ
jgi:methyl-accepting chemotaxis protein